MEGLIKQQMQGAPAEEQMPPQQTPPQQQMPAEMQPEMDEEGGAEPDSDPGYMTALEYAMRALYEKGAADDIAKSLSTAQDPVEGLANTAYEITAIVDERTDGAVPDELFALLAAKILEEVADIGMAAGVDYKPSDVALALKQMILRYLGEQGMDTSELQQAMDQVDPEEFNRMAQGQDAEVPA